jgi:inorganic triphosphatase YgiF
MNRGPRAPAEPRRAGREVEVSLVIAAEDPEKVLRRVAKLRELAGYRLHPRGSEHIVDSYFDTPSGALRKQGWALRLRAIGGATLIGLKGPQRERSTHTEDRFERERPFALDALEEIRRRTQLAGRAAHAEAAQKAGPAELLEAQLGVGLIQRRETTRLVRDVADSREPSGPVLAEMVLDRVRFEIEHRTVRHYEVEIEAKRTGRGTKAVRDISTELNTRYDDELVKWSYGKLPTGRAIEELLLRGLLDGIGPDGALTPRGYEQLRRHLERESGA